VPRARRTLRFAFRRPGLARKRRFQCTSQGSERLARLHPGSIQQWQRAPASELPFRPIAQPNGDNTIELFSKNGSIGDLVGLLSKFMDRPVLNQTGIQGKFDFAIDYDANSDAPGAFSGATGPGMFRAFQDQLGLKLEATKGSVDVLVIDRAERPSSDN
jgi:uncharacterized protein (TIGR03435 family)